MNKRDRVRIEAINRIATFVANNKTALNSLGDAPKKKALALADTFNGKKTGLVDRLEGFETGRESGSIDFHEGTVTKATLRDGIMLDLIFWNEAAAAIAAAEKTPEIMRGFRVPHGASTEVFAARVRAICDHAAEMSAKFVDLAFGDDFVAQMRSRVDAFELATEEQDTGLSNRTGAHGGLSSVIREGMVASRQMNVIFKNLYQDNPEKLTAWATAYHTERVGVGGKNKKSGNGANTPTSPQRATTLSVNATNGHSNGANGNGSAERATSLSVGVVANGHSNGHGNGNGHSETPVL